MERIEVSIVMYILFVGAALIMGALSAIIFINIYRKSKRAGLFLAALFLLWFIYPMFTLSNISGLLALTVFVIYLFYGIAAFRKLKVEEPVPR